LKNIFDAMSVKKRFFLIGIVFISFSVYQIISDSFSKLYILQQASQQQYESLIFIKDINAFINNVQKTRGLTNIYLNHAQIDVKLILKKSANLQIQLNSLMKKYKVHTNSDLHSELSLIQDELKLITKNISIFTAETIFYKYTLVVERLMSIIDLASQRVNISNTSNTTSQLLLELLIKELPFVIENLGNARGIMAGNLSMTNIETKNRNVSFFNKLISLDMKKVNIRLQTISKFNHNLTDKIKETIFILEQNSDEFIKLLTSQVKEKKALDSYDFYLYSTQIINQYIHIYNYLFEIMQEEIAQNNQKQQIEVYTKISIEILALILTLVLFIHFYRSSLEYIERIQKAEKAKSSFLSNMSHEIRTPLNAIVGFIKILQEDKHTPKERDKYLGIVQESTKQLLFIINDILDFSKIEDNKLKIEQTSFNLEKEFLAITDLFLANAKNKDITLTLDISDDLPKYIKSDHFRLKQIISNLLSNSIKFTQEGGFVKLIAKKKNNKLHICVQDNGMGIAKEKQENIFKTFSQADESTTRKFGGTGLGLAICYKLVELLGSKLELESQENVGSKFFFNLDIVPCYENEPQESTPLLEQKYEGRILLVEDNPTNQFLMEVTFGKLDLEVILANDGQEAIEKFKQDKFKIIFMDENMPNKNGIEATKEIRAMEKEKKP
jgi:signal transduction histidine kinase